MTVLRIAFGFRLAPIMRIQDVLKQTVIKKCKHSRNKIIKISKSAYSYPAILVLHTNI